MSVVVPNGAKPLPDRIVSLLPTQEVPDPPIRPLTLLRIVTRVPLQPFSVLPVWGRIPTRPLPDVVTPIGWAPVLPPAPTSNQSTVVPAVALAKKVDRLASRNVVDGIVPDSREATVRPVS